MSRSKAYHEDLLYEYGLNEPYIENHKEQLALKGFARKKYEREHFAELEYNDYYRQVIKDKIKEPDKKTASCIIIAGCRF